MTLIEKLEKNGYTVKCDKNQFRKNIGSKAIYSLAIYYKNNFIKVIPPSERKVFFEKGDEIIETNYKEIYKSFYHLNDLETQNVNSVFDVRTMLYINKVMCNIGISCITKRYDKDLLKLENTTRIEAFSEKVDFGEFNNKHIARYLDCCDENQTEILIEFNKKPTQDDVSTAVLVEKIKRYFTHVDVSHDINVFEVNRKHWLDGSGGLFEKFMKIANPYKF